jgi:hypothetical protein
MPATDSILDPLAMARARRLLATPVRRERVWPALAAAGFAAVGAMVLATAMIFLAPAAPATQQIEQ